ncbi:MAG: 3-hydroxyacyl-CoA dehydrogenase NAD-binding domain-containing protein [Marinibacterium sp.]|nr:3-hydroxyacyl-CoA dehydrogenase NAD-binding domain-containing protein [Marinibacterium sp.]
MTSINAVVDFTVEYGIGIITLNAPPVNALSVAVRAGLADALAAAGQADHVHAVVLICAGRTFIAGADLTEFGKPPQDPTLDHVLSAIEGADKPVVAAIHGTALGGGFEVALACHYRVAATSAQVGLPEVHVGLLPGAGGTQRLPRIVGMQKALELITFGTRVPAPEALDLGILDAVFEDEALRSGAIAFARRLVADARPLRRLRDEDAALAPARADRSIFDTFARTHARKLRGRVAPGHIRAALEAALDLPFDAALQRERALFVELCDGPQSKAMRYAFFAERQAARVPDLAAGTPRRPIARVGVIGAGTMGGGIAMNFANAGIPVIMVERAQDALDRGLATIRRNYERTARRGGLSEADVDTRMGLITGAIGNRALADCDLVIEAAFEVMDVKKAIFRELDGICKPGAILASNTSYLDINEIAVETGRPGDVIGLHFFSPANVMRLLEIVRGSATAPDVIATCMALAKTIAKVPVLVGVCHGFVGNRMLELRQREANRLILEGASPYDVDRVLYDFGFPMGPFAMGDLAGLDLRWDRDTTASRTIREMLNEAGRHGHKAGAGYYDYDENRRPSPSDQTLAIIDTFRARHGHVARAISDDEILQRPLFMMINEGLHIMGEGIAERASDIDTVWLNGYGWPVYRGGPMHYADQIGAPVILDRLRAWQSQFGDDYAPAPLLKDCAERRLPIAGLTRTAPRN